MNSFKRRIAESRDTPTHNVGNTIYMGYPGKTWIRLTKKRYEQ